MVLVSGLVFPYHRYESMQGNGVIHGAKWMSVSLANIVLVFPCLTIAPFVRYPT